MRNTIILIFFFFLHSSLYGAWGEIKTIRSSSTKHIDFNKTWTKGHKSDFLALKELIFVLAKSPTGKKLLLKAKKKVNREPLLNFIKVGDHSLTDTTLVRRFSARNPHEMKFETKSKVFVNRSLSYKDALLDLAHELTHFTLRGQFNPYASTMGVRSFIKSTIEGHGGEVEAFITECKVSFELFTKQDHGKCSKLIDESTGELSFAKGVEYFYYLGDHYKKVEQELFKHQLTTDHFIHMNEDDSLFISSAYGVPYPLAAIFEFNSIMGKVCANDKKRLSLMKSGRGIASVQQVKNFKQNLVKRCSHFTEF